MDALTITAISAVSLIVAGIAMIRHWHRSAMLFLSALAMLSFSIIVSLLQYGNMGHPILMNGIAIVMVVVLVYFIGLIYAFEHFMFHLDTDEENAENQNEKSRRRVRYRGDGEPPLINCTGSPSYNARPISAEAYHLGD